MRPEVRELYEYAERKWPELLKSLQSLDADLAEVHFAGINLQNTRQALLDSLARLRARPEVIQP